jgi:hypothetical protein
MAVFIFQTRRYKNATVEHYNVRVVLFLEETGRNDSFLAKQNSLVICLCYYGMIYC